MKSCYISFHIHNFGIGFTKNILGAFYQSLVKVTEPDSKKKYVQQTRLENAFSGRDKGFVFDKVYYLHVQQETINKVTSTRAYKEQDKERSCIDAIKHDDQMRDTRGHWIELLKYSANQTKSDISQNELAIEIDYINQNFRPDIKDDIMNEYWRLIHYYNIEDQKLWLYNYANSREIYDEKRFNFINLQELTGLTLDDLHDHQKIANAIHYVLK